MLNAAAPGVTDAVCIQGYIGRWEIEVNHREEKDGLGTGRAQVWNLQSVPRTPALEVGCYTALLLSSIATSQDRHTEAFGPLPKWRKEPPQRPSLRDLIRLTRQLGRFKYSAYVTNLELKAVWTATTYTL